MRWAETASFLSALRLALLVNLRLDDELDNEIGPLAGASAPPPLAL